MVKPFIASIKWWFALEMVRLSYDLIILSLFFIFFPVFDLFFVYFFFTSSIFLTLICFKFWFFLGLVFELNHVFGLVYSWTKDFRSNRSGWLGQINPTGSKLDQGLRTFLVDNVFLKVLFALKVCLANTLYVYFNSFGFRKI